MGKMSSLATAFSGLKAAQAGLYVTGHNTSNAETVGYVRQQVLQKDFFYNNIGVNHFGKMQVGLGTDIYGIRQIRDKFLDISYRKEASKLGFYETKAQVGREMETIIGEMQSDYRMEAIISDMWDSINELSIYQPGLDTRGNFISTCTTFLTKVNNVYDRMFDYMHNIDEQIIDCVKDVNDYLDRINELNVMKFSAEPPGDNANDYRDERNDLLDRLSVLIPISYSETNKQVKILSEGKELLANGVVTHIGFKYCSSDYYFVEPILTESKEILPASAPAGSYKPLFEITGPVDAEHGNDSGRLKALLACRGYEPTNWASDAESLRPDPADPKYGVLGDKDPQYELDYKYYQKMKFNEEHAFIPRLMKEFDTLVHSIITMINDAVSPKIDNPAYNPNDPNSPKYIKDPNAPYDLYGNQSYTEVFTRMYEPYSARFNGNNYIDENPDDYYSLYTIGNIMINPVFSNPDGYNQLALSISGDPEDTRLVFDKLMDGWNKKIVPVGDGLFVSIDEAYQMFINSMSIETSEAINYADRQADLILEVDGKRQMISGVSLDEEMENMMIFSHAYNAAARVVNVIDGMLDKVINGTGRVGL